VSRNNDVGGYWAIGKLYAHARKNQTQNLVVNLAATQILPDGLEFHPMLLRYSQMLVDRLAYYNVSMESILAARILLSFDAAVAGCATASSSLPGLPFRCTFEVIDKVARMYSASHLGVARPHNRLRETRSARA
jgi:hypothetical protein